MRTERLRRAAGLLVPVLTVALVAFAYLWDPLVVQTARHAVFDQFQRWQPRVYQPAPVRIIDIDDESLRRLGQWPWPRTRIAELTTVLQKSQATAIAFDMVFAEPDRTSPAAMLALWQPPADIAREISGLPDHDAVLAGVVANGRVVLGFALDRQVRGPAEPPRAKARFVTLNAPALPFVSAFTGSVTALPALEAAADGYGALSFVPDADGVIRRVPLLVRQGNTLLPALSTEALRVAQGAQNITTVATGSQGLETLRIGSLVVPITPQGELWVHYSRPAPERYIPAWKVLAGVVPASELAGHIVLVGTSAQGLMDLRFNALGTVIPGVEIHAQALEQVLTGGGLKRPAWAEMVELTGIIFGGLLVGAVALRGRALQSAALTTLLLAWVCGVAWSAFSSSGLLLDPVMPGMALLLSFVMTSVVHHVRAEQRQRWVKQAFSRYVSPNLVNHLMAHPDALQLGGRRQHCSFVFTDLEGFTHLMEDLDPSQAVALLNGYLEGMIAIAFAHQGTLDRIVGDSLAIVFSAPLAQPDHPRRALQCALEMQRFAQQYAGEVHARGIAFGQTRMGVHTGEVIVGNFGGATMFDYRALGDAVNTASRLEGANRHLGTRICMSAAVLSACPGASARPIGRLVLKGKLHPLMVFEPLDAATAPTDGAYPAAYTDAYALMQHGAPQAVQAFEVLVGQHPTDKLAAMHLARLREGQTGDLVVLDQK